MNNEKRYDRSMALPARPDTEDPPNLARGLYVIGPTYGRRTKIFMIKQVIRSRSIGGSDRKMRHILIFDDHPDSLRLVFAGRAIRDRHFSVLPRVNLWELIIVSILTIVGLSRHILAVALR
jgi:hypothetical protein